LDPPRYHGWCFVPNISFGFPVISRIRDAARKPLDVHLMIVEPDATWRNLKMQAPQILTVHVEACNHLDRTLSAIYDSGMKPAVALNPHTPVSVVENVLSKLYMVLLMTVNPGSENKNSLITPSIKSGLLRK